MSLRIALMCDWHLKYGSDLAKALAATGTSVALVCRDHALEFGDDRGEWSALMDSVRDAGVTVIVVPGRVSSVTRAPTVARSLWAVARWRPDVVHAQENQDPRYLALALRYPRVYTVHDPVLHPGAPKRGRVLTATQRAWVRFAHRVIVHSDLIIGELEPAEVRKRVVVVPHGTTPFPVAIPPPARKRVLFFGRLEEYKGLPVLTDAMTRVWKVRPDIRLSIVGQGPLAATLGDDSRIEKRIGYIPEAEIDAMFAGASLVVLPYTQASQSGVGLRAIARGVPVIVTAVGGLRELVSSASSSFVVPPADAASLAHAVLTHIDHEIELRREVLSHARHRFSWEAIAEETRAVYDDAIAEARRR